MSLLRLVSNLRKSRKPYELMTGGIHKDITLPFTDEVELYHSTISTASQKVRVCLAQKMIPYKSHIVDWNPNHSKSNQIHNNSAEYTFINPQRLVPTLIHNGHPVYDSHDIIKYIHSNINGNNYNLIPLQCNAITIDTWMDRGAMYGDLFDVENLKLRAGNCIAAMTVPVIIRRTSNATYTEIIEMSVLGKRRLFPLTAKLFQSQLLNSKKVTQLVENSTFYMKQHLNELNDLLLTNKTYYIGGDEFSMADIPWVIILERCRLLKMFDDDFNINGAQLIGLKHYWEMIQQENCYKVGILNEQGYLKAVEKYYA
eukprot:233554_1